MTKELFHLTLQDVMIGILDATLLNYLLLIAKSFIYMGLQKNIAAFKQRAKIKYETYKFICVKTNCMDKVNKKWALCLDNILNFLSVCLLKTGSALGFVINGIIYVLWIFFGWGGGGGGIM